MSDNRQELLNNLENLKRTNSKKCIYSDYDIVNIMLEKIAENPELIDNVPKSSVAMSQTQLEIFEDIVKNNRSAAYIKVNYDFEAPLNELKFEEVLEMYTEMCIKKERLKAVHDYTRLIDETTDPDSLTENLIDKLMLISTKKLDKKSVEEIFFFEKSVYGGEFIKVEEYLNAPTIPIGIDFFDNHKEKRFVCPTSLGYLLLQTSQGKTSLLIYFALSLLKQGYKVMFCYGEMTKAEIARSFIPFVTEGEITEKDIKNNNIEKYHELLPELHKKYGDKFITLGPSYYSNGFRTSSIDLSIRKYKPDIVLIDYLQLIHGSAEWKDRISKPLKDMCVKYNVTMICGVMSNELVPEYYKKSNKEREGPVDQYGIPVLHDISDCKRFSNDADWVLAGKSYSQEPYEGIIYKFAVRKARQGFKVKTEDIPEYVMNHGKGTFIRKENINTDLLIVNNDLD